MNQPAPDFAPAAVRCPHCGRDVRYFDSPQSTYFGCPACRTFFKASAPEPPKKLRRFEQQPTHTRPLALSSTGQLDGETYRITGYQWRCEAKEPDYRWEEFQLRHETTGANRQLAVFDGHWLLIEPSDEQYKPNKEDTITTTEQEFQLYNRYSPRVLYAEGEFDWNILADENLKISEYISPPQMLVRERNSSKHDAWFAARHLEPREVAEAFGVPLSQLPARTGVGAIQPAPAAGFWPQLRTFSLLMVLAVVLTHIFLMQWGNETVFNQEFVSPAPAPGAKEVPERPMQVSPAFMVPGTGALTVDLWASVDNSWVEIPYALVNEQTGEQFAATGNLEHYSGVEGGESWQEGDRDVSTLLNQVPAGRYHLNFYPLADPVKAEQVQFRATVRARATAGSNAVLALLLLLVYPAYLYLRRYSHEHTRWQNSDFGP